MKEPQIQIPKTLFWDLFDYFLCENDDDDKEILFEQIAQGINDKFEKMVTHDYYTRYKRTPPENAEERNALRKEYLDRQGILPSFRTDEEVPEELPPDDIDLSGYKDLFEDNKPKE